MNKKLFAYNSGLKSRFREVVFEDFDETELSECLGRTCAPKGLQFAHLRIWVQAMKDRGWQAQDPRLTDVAVRRMGIHWPSAGCRQKILSYLKS